MFRKIQYIISLFLLLIFPLSAMGMDISIHKCKHKGTVHYSFFGSHSHSDCCCAEGTLSHNGKAHQCDQCLKEKGLKSVPDCCPDKSTEPIEKAPDSCCNSNNNAPSEKSDSKLIQDNYSTNAISACNAPCCTNSELLSGDYITVLSLDIYKYLQIQPLLISDQYRIQTEAKLDNNTSFNNEIHYPIKRLITQIISCIHFSSIIGYYSNISGNIYC
jgi:hypothetical protein